MPRRLLALALPVALIAAVAAVLTGPPGARAEDRQSFVLVGTSDVYDSGLVQQVLEPGFEKAYPAYDLQYVSKGTGAAIAYAEAGTADGLVVHAAALENQFVADGYSNEPYGRAIFWGDYVLLGPDDDPAGVLASAPHDIATAFEKVAAAGAAGTANFVSRGGTPGTTVQEHAIWALTQNVGTCTVSAANGGGTSPSTSTGACPSQISYPSWYHATGLTQGPNILNADTCNYDGGECYVFTDRGTYNYLRSTDQAQGLQIVTRDNGATVRGGRPLLVNSFHAYAIDPDKFADSPDVQLNTAAATDFLNWVTSAPVQAQIGRYLADAGDAPFLPSAAPRLSAAATPAKVRAGRSFTVRGSLTNVVPGTPALAGVRVNLVAVRIESGVVVPKLVQHVVTDAEGRYRFRFEPRQTQRYLVTTPTRIQQIEDAALSPVFGDLLQGTSVSAGKVVVVPGKKPR